jgi:S1-C subfamily serine protease
MKWFGFLGLGLFVVSLFNFATPTREPAPENVIARSLAASVQLYSEREGGTRRWASGVALSGGENGRALILTAAHLLVPTVQQSVYATTPGTTARAEAKILAIDEDADVAVLEAADLEVAPATLKTDASLGDNVWVVSFPWGRRGTVVSGVVSQIATEEADSRLPVSGPVSLIDAAVSYGTSGGGVFDARTGQLIGLVRGYRTAKLSLPGTPPRSLDVPIAGETTVIPVTAIRCLLARTSLDEALKTQLLGVSPSACVDT